MELSEFLLARIDEDEETARSGFSHPERWVRQAPVGIPTGLSCTAVLAECEAKRRIVERARFYIAESDRTEDDADLTRDRGGRVHGLATAYEEVLEHLALPYADHPEYDESWRP